MQRPFLHIAQKKSVPVTIELVPEYRPDIDGLRAIAVILVIGYHAFPNLVKGGFIGVDIFFVISGYLISTILFTNLWNNKFSLSDFYFRRIRRIFPALIVVMGACLAFGWFALLAGEYKQLGKHIAGGAGFVSNFLLWNESGYFDNTGDTKPLLHLWSLGIEEQFYILWPILLLLASQRGVNFLVIASTVAGISFSLNLISQDGVAGFYSPQTRFWELLVGSALAYVVAHNTFVLKPIGYLIRSFRAVDHEALSDLKSLLGAFLLGASMIVIDNERYFPGIWATMPVMGTLMIINAGRNALINRVVLASRPLVWLGLISYPLYLWHWPLLSFAGILEGDIPSFAIRMAGILAALILSSVTYVIVEKPMRFGNGRKMKVAVLGMLMLLVGSAGYLTYTCEGLQFRRAVTEHQLISEAVGDWKYPAGLTKFEMDGVTLYGNSSNAPEVLFFGDSHVEQFGPRLVSLSSSPNSQIRPVAFLSGGGCPPIPFVYEDRHPFCREHINNLRKILKRLPQVDTLLIGGCWNCYFLWEAEAEKKGYNYYHSKDGVRHNFRGGGGANYALRSLKEFLEEMNKYYTVYFLLDNPAGPFFDPKTILRKRLGSNTERMEESSLGASELVLNDELKSMGEALGLKIIDQVSHVCPDYICVRLNASGAPIYSGWDHFRPWYVIDSASYIDVVWQQTNNGRGSVRAVVESPAAANLRGR